VQCKPEWFESLPASRERIGEFSRPSASGRSMSRCVLCYPQKQQKRKTVSSHQKGTSGPASRTEGPSSGGRHRIILGKKSEKQLFERRHRAPTGEKRSEGYGIRRVQKVWWKEKEDREEGAQGAFEKPPGKERRICHLPSKDRIFALKGGNDVQGRAVRKKNRTPQRRAERRRRPL